MACEGKRAAPTAGVDSLPDELTLTIFSFVGFADTGPSAIKFDGETSSTLTTAPWTPIKDLAVVCKRWRRILLPLLFEWSRVSLTNDKRWLVCSRQLQRHFQLHVKGHPGRSAHEDAVIQDVDDVCNGGPSKLRPASPLGTPTYYIQDNDHYLHGAPEEYKLWAPSPLGEIHDYLRLITSNHLSRHVRSLVLQTDAVVVELNWARAETQRLWRAIFAAVDPSRVVIAAPPATMAVLADSRLGTRDAWLFDARHYLELTKPESDTVRSTQSEDRSPPPSPSYQASLFNHRSWTGLAYNEGSNIKVYSKHEYFKHTPPRILRHLLLWFSRDCDRDHVPKLESLRYISIYPFGTHVFTTLEPLNSIQLQKLTLKLASSPDSDLPNGSRRGSSRRVKSDADQQHLRREHKCSCSALVKLLLARQYGDEGFCLQLEDYKTERLRRPMDRVFARLNSGSRQLWSKSTTDDSACRWTRRPG